MLKAEKQERVDRLRAELAGTESLVVAGYTGLTVLESQQLRADMRNAGGQIRIIKNSLARLSIADTDLAVVQDDLVGANLFAFGNDPVGPAKVIAKAAKDGKKIVIKAGALNGKRLSSEEVVALSKLPGIDELRAKYLGVLAAVPSKFVGQLAAAPRSLLTVLSARRDNLEEATA